MNTVGVPQGLPRNGLRVLYVIPGEAEGASMIFAKRQAASFRKLAVVVDMFFLASRTSPFVLAKEWLRLRRKIQTFKPDLVHAQFGTMTAFLCAIAKKSPLVVTYQGTDLNRSYSISRMRSGAGRFLSRIAALRANQIICVSEELKRRLWCGRGRTTVVPSGVDTTIFYARSREEARTELGWEQEERVVLFNAGWHPRHKRLDLAQSAIDVASSITGEIRVVLLDGYVEPRAIPLMMNGADCLLLTSENEGSPNIVKEALACNLPVVSVDVGDVRERLDGVRPSEIVAREPNAIAQGVSRILRRSERSNGSLFAQEFSLDRIAVRILAIYLNALKQNR